MSNVTRLFLGEYFSQTIAAYTLYAIMFGERGGLSAVQVGTILGAFSLSTLAAEIPTGLIADKISRKYALVASKLLMALAMATWLVAPTFTGYRIGIILMGISDSLSSGAMQAYLYDNIDNPKRNFSRYNTRLWSVMMAGFLTGSGIAALINTRYSQLLLVSMISPIIGSLVFMTLKSDRVLVHDRTVSLLKSSWNHLVNSKMLLYASAFVILLKALVDTLIEYIPVYYRDSGVASRYVPLLFFIGNAITIVLFWYATSISKFMKRAELRWLVVLLMGFIASRYFGTVFSVLGIYWFIRFTRVLYVYEEGEIQHLYESRFRATITSINSMFVRLTMAIIFPLIGFFSTQYYDGRVLTPIIVFSALGVGALCIIKIRLRALGKTMS